MLQERIDLFAAWHAGPYATVITTNGDTNTDTHQAVMGRGTAKWAADTWPEVRKSLGRLLEGSGNHCYVLPVTRDQGAALVSFPVKRHWREAASLDLIERSLIELKMLRTIYGWQRVFLPRPGCGAGWLRWSEVRPLVEQYLTDDVYTVCWLPTEPVQVKTVFKRGAVSKAAAKRMASK